MFRRCRLVELVSGYQLIDDLLTLINCSRNRELLYIQCGLCSQQLDISDDAASNFHVCKYQSPLCVRKLFQNRTI
jgi:hypothetical protein